jgi:hypothetical protein
MDFNDYAGSYAHHTGHYFREFLAAIRRVWAALT